MKPTTEKTADGWRYTYLELGPGIGVDVHPVHGRDDAGAEVTVWGLQGETWVQASAPTAVTMTHPVSKAMLAKHLTARPISRGAGIDWATVVEQVCAFTLKALRPGPSGAPKTQRADALMAKHLEPPREVIPGVVMEGLWILAGAPKIGKSWLVLNWLLAVGSGGVAMSSIAVDGGGGLYLALEDSEIRLQSRLRAILGDDSPPATFEYATDWTALSAGGTDELDAWLTAHPQTRIVAIDTLAKATGRTADGNNSRLYEQDYHSLAGLQSLAAKHHVAIIVLHHRRKGGADDIVETVTGTMGLAGAADGIIVLDRRRQSAKATLHIISRDLPADQALAIEWDDAMHQWVLRGNAETVDQETAGDAVLDWLIEADEPQNARDIEAVTHINGGTIRRALAVLVKRGKVARTGRGMYAATVEGRESSAKVDHAGEGVINGFGNEAPQNAKLDRGDQVIKSGGFEYENGDSDLITPPDLDQVFEPNTNGNEDDDHLITPIIFSRGVPKCPACGTPRGPTDFCAGCKTRLCRVCGQETGSVIRAVCLLNCTPPGTVRRSG